MQSIHSDFIKNVHELDIAIFCDALESPANVGGVLRLADAYGASKVIFFEGVNQITPRVKSVSRGTQNYIDFEFCTEFDFDEREWFCLELTSSSESLSQFNPQSKRIGIIIGNENRGVRGDFIERFQSYHVRMFGNNSSMNVTNALSAALYSITN